MLVGGFSISNAQDPSSRAAVLLEGDYHLRQYKTNQDAIDKARAERIARIEARIETANNYYAQALTKAEAANYEGAIWYCTQAINSYKKHPSAYHVRAVCKWKLGNNNGALADCNKAIRYNKKEGTYLVLKGDIYRSMGQKLTACHYYGLAEKKGSHQGWEQQKVHCQ